MVHMASIGWSDVRPKPSGKWEGRWAIEGGKVKGKCFNTKEQARKYAMDQANGLLDARVGLTVYKKAIDEAVTEWLDTVRHVKTKALYERRINEFIDAYTALELGGELRIVNQITDRAINKFDAFLAAKGCNPGGRNHVLRIVRTFCRFSRKKKWLADYPFEDFKMPQSEFEGRPLTPVEFERICGPREWTGGNQHAEHPTWGGSNQHDIRETDLWLARAFRLGRGTMLRISHVWAMTPKQFKAPDQLWVPAIKGQDPVWITLHPEALAVINDLLAVTGPGERFFKYWKTVESMRDAVKDKARSVGLTGVRFHDACKVTRVSELAAAGFSLAELEHVSNTTQKTLIGHYIKADRNRSFDRYKAFSNLAPAVCTPQTIPRPRQDRETGDFGGAPGIAGDSRGNGNSHNSNGKNADITPLDETI